MKKKLLIILVLSMLAFGAVACTDAEGNESQGTIRDMESSGEPENNKEEDNPKTESNEEKPKVEDGQKESAVGNQAEEFQEITAVDNEQCSIKITGIDPDNMWGYAVKTVLENKSSDKEYMYSVESASVNGVQIDPFFASTVSAGKKSNESVSFSDSSFEGIEIGNFTDIEITFRVYDNDDWMADNVAHETIHIYPNGEENITLYSRAPQKNDIVIADNENVKVTVIGYEKDDIWGYNVKVFLENKTDQEVMFSIDEASVNGYMADPFYAQSVIPGKCAFGFIEWDSITLEENGVKEVEEIEFVLKAYDSNSFSTDFFSEKIKLNPKQ